MKSLICFALLFCSLQVAKAQSGDNQFIIPTTNSKAVTKQIIASTQIEVTYNRPNKKGRQIFGNLVPYGQIWRTGSDASTKIQFSTSVQISGHPVEAGIYEIFTIPGKDKWEIILQKSQQQWGSYAYNPENDVAKFSVVPVISKQITETFTISFDDIKSNEGTIKIVWDDIIIPIKLTIDIKATVIPGLEAALKSEGRKPFFQAAMFYYENNIDIDRAVELMGKALEQNPGHIGMLYRQALILEKKGDIKKAISAAEESLAGTEKVNQELKAEYFKLNSVLLERLKSKQ